MTEQKKKRKWWQRFADFVKKAIKFAQSEEGKEIIEDAKDLGESVKDAVDKRKAKKDGEQGG